MTDFWFYLATNWNRVTLALIGLALIAIGMIIEQRRELITGELTEAEQIYLHVPGNGCILAGAVLLATAFDLA